MLGACGTLWVGLCVCVRMKESVQVNCAAWAMRHTVMCGKKQREKERAREEWMRGSERASERGVDGKESEPARERTERCSGQARDAWLESGQARMRPPLSTKRVPYSSREHV